jgi:hypothetical protein
LSNCSSDKLASSSNVRIGSNTLSARAKPLSPKYKNSLDEIASALLDDTVVSTKGATRNTLKAYQSLPVKGSRGSPSTTAHTSKFRFDGGIQGEFLPKSSEPSSSESHSQINTSKRPKTRVQKTSPTVPRKSSKRQPKTTRSDGIGWSHKDLSPNRPLPQSSTASTIRHPQPIYQLPISGSGPLSSHPVYFNGKLPDSPDTAKTPLPRIRYEEPDPNEINRKVAAMLAATELLKPQGNLKPSAAQSKLSRMVPTRMLAKVTHALERLQSKPGHHESNSGDNIAALTSQDYSNLPGALGIYNIKNLVETEEPSRASVNHIFNRDLSSNIDSPQIPRQPVLHKTDLTSREAAFESQDDMESTMEYIEHQTSYSTHHDRYSSQSLVIDPFKTEKNFENDLEGELSSSPIGHSTPRVRVGKAVEFTSSSPGPQGSKSQDAYGRYSPDALSVYSEASFNKIGERQESREIRVERLHREREINAHGAVDFHDPKRTKKHPSPSKLELEALENQFREYAQMQTRFAAPEDRDELANTFAGLCNARTAHTLSPRDTNKFGPGNRLSKESHKSINDKKRFKEVASKSPGFPQSNPMSRVPRPGGDNLSKLPRRGGRYGVPFHPVGDPDAMDIDELQWDMSAYQIGSTHTK